MLIYKIAFNGDWMEAIRSGVFEGSTKDREDGFIHFSTAEQLEETLRLHYARSQRPLAVSAVEADTLGTSLRWEPSRDGALFPHLYGTLPMAAVRLTMVGFYETLAADNFSGVRDFVARRGVYALEKPAV